MRKDQYQFVVVYCKLQENGYAKCNRGPDCRHCDIGKAAQAAKGGIKSEA